MTSPYADIAIFGTTSVWDYLIELRDSVPGGDKLVEKIKTLQKTDMGRARALIRYVDLLLDPSLGWTGIDLKVLLRAL